MEIIYALKFKIIVKIASKKIFKLLILNNDTINCMKIL